MRSAVKVVSLSRSPPGEAAAFVVGARVAFVDAVAPAFSGESVEAGGAARVWSCGPRSASRMFLTAKRFRRDCGLRAVDPPALRGLGVGIVSLDVGRRR
jgi:hypothetical protein